VLFVSSRRRHTRSKRDWSSDVCSSDLVNAANNIGTRTEHALGVLHTLGTGHALNDDLGIRVEKNSHEKFSSFKSLGVDGYGGISKFSCGAGGFIHGCHLLKLRQVSVFQN